MSRCSPELLLPAGQGKQDAGSCRSRCTPASLQAWHKRGSEHPPRQPCRSNCPEIPEGMPKPVDEHDMLSSDMHLCGGCGSESADKPCMQQALSMATMLCNLPTKYCRPIWSSDKQHQQPMSRIAINRLQKLVIHSQILQGKVFCVLGPESS